MLPAIIVLLLLTGSEDETLAPFRPGILPLTFPVLDRMEPVVHDHIRSVQSELAARIAASPDQISEIGEGYALLARVYHAHELMQTAEICYRNALLLRPDRFDCTYLLAKLFHQKSDLAAAEEWYARAGAMAPDYTATWINLGEIALGRNDLATSRKLFRRVLELNPESPAACFGLGRAALAEGNAEEAVTQFRRTLALQPAADRIHYSLGMAYRKLGKNEEAREQLARAGKIGVRATDPLFDELQNLVKSERIHLVQGKTAFNARHYADAEKEFRLALAANPESNGALLNLGTTLAVQGHAKEAVEAYRKVLERDPENQTVHYNLGNLYTRLNQPDLAATFLTRAVSLNPDDLQARMELADLLRDRGDLAAAFEQVDQVARSNPANEDALLRRAHLQIAMGNYAKAGELLAADNARAPTMGRLAHLYARFLASCPQTDLRDGERAVALATQVVNARPAAQYLETLAMAHAQSGHCAEAVTWQQRAVAAARAEQRPDLAAQLEADLNLYQHAPPCPP